MSFPGDHQEELFFLEFPSNLLVNMEEGYVTTKLELCQIFPGLNLSKASKHTSKHVYKLQHETHCNSRGPIVYHTPPPGQSQSPPPCHAAATAQKWGLLRFMLSKLQHPHATRMQCPSINQPGGRCDWEAWPNHVCEACMRRKVLQLLIEHQCPDNELIAAVETF